MSTVWIVVIIIAVILVAVGVWYFFFRAAVPAAGSTVSGIPPITVPNGIDYVRILAIYNKVGGANAKQDSNGNYPWISADNTMWYGTDSNTEYLTAQSQLKAAGKI